MSQNGHFEPALRVDGGPDRWGLYSRAADRWLDVVFSSRREAEEAAKIVQGVPAERRPSPD